MALLFACTKNVLSKCSDGLNLPVLSYGASIGWMSPMSLLLQSKDSPRKVPLTDTEVSWMAAIPYLICVPLNTFIAYFADKYGRKLALILISLAGAASWTLLLISLDIWALMLARALVGVTMSGCYVICPIYTKEISGASIRGALGCFVILFHTIGNLFLYVLGDLLSYSDILWICLTIPVIQLVLFVFMPDSPSYLHQTRGNLVDITLSPSVCFVQNCFSWCPKQGYYHEAATKAITWLRCKSESDIKVQEELNSIRNEHKLDNEGNQFFLKTIFTDKILFKAFQIAMITTLAREVCGAIPVLNFAGEIFTLASDDGGLVLSPNQQAMLLGVVQVVGSIFASSLVEKCGRKPLLFISSLISGLSMCLLASWFLTRAYGVLAPSWIPLLTLCLCIFCDSSGLQPMSMVLVGEIFSFKYRGTVMAAAMCGASLSDFLQLLFFKPLANSVGIHVAFYFFGFTCLLMALYVIIVIPETRSRSLEDIYRDLGKKDLDEITDKKNTTV